LLGLIGILIAYASVSEPRFMTWQAQSVLSTHLWELAIVVLPMFLIILSAGIDLSVGAMVALSAVVLGLTFEGGLALELAIFLAVAMGALLGMTNGTLITRLHVHPLVVTLATMAAYRGIAEGASQARAISGYPETFTRLATQPWMGVVFPGWMFVVLLLLTGYVLARSNAGRWIVALGTAERATRFSGVPVDRLKVWLYTFCGLCCGLAAVLLVARNNTAKADLAMGMELEAITVVVLGGASINGGAGSIWGTVLALVAVHLVREFVSWHWQKNELVLIAMGGLLIVSVIAQRITETKSRSL
jgi:rhamnose transport system permease protein